MRKITTAVAVVLLSFQSMAFAASNFGKPLKVERLPKLSHPQLELLAQDFHQILHDDVTAPFNGEWGFVSRTGVPPLKLDFDVIIKDIAISELCNKLKACPDSLELSVNPDNNVGTLVDFAGVFLFQLGEETPSSKHLEMVRQSTLNKLYKMISFTLESASKLVTLVGFHQSAHREGSFAAFFDSENNELLIIGSNARP